MINSKTARKNAENYNETTHKTTVGVARVIEETSKSGYTNICVDIAESSFKKIAASLRKRGYRVYEEQHLTKQAGKVAVSIEW